MPFDPHNLIERYQASQFAGMPARYHSRYQFDFVYLNFRQFQPISSAVRQRLTKTQSALWLASLLAHWGMFRGSSRIKDTNVRFFEDLLDGLIDAERGVLSPLIGISFEALPQVNTSTLETVIQETRQLFAENGVSPTATLISKTILGIFGNVPAYDRLFNLGLRRIRDEDGYTGRLPFSGPGLQELSAWCAQYQWPPIRSAVDGRYRLPRGRLVDMAIMRYGFEAH